MDIDLLFDAQDGAGLISDKNYPKKAVGVLVDVQSGLLTLEYADMDFLETNIPLDGSFVDGLAAAPFMHVGAVINGDISQAYQVPLMFLDDPYRGELLGQAIDAGRPLQAFERFLKTCVTGQPVHRDDLSDDSSMGCVLGDVVPSNLQFAPHLARRHGLEIKPSALPQAPGMNAPGLGSTGIVRSTGGRSNSGDDSKD